MRLRKYHGAGNDFVMLADLEARMGPPGSLAPDLVSALCDRHTGIGADGVIRILAEPGDAERRMDYYNADGSPAEMCGNGIRCLVLHEQRAGRLDDSDHIVMTVAGPVIVRGQGAGRFTVDMGTPVLRREDIPMTGSGSSLRVEVALDGDSLRGSAVSMGNPHLVLFTDEIGRALDDDLVLGLGPRLEVHPDFPARTNVEFVEVVNATTLRLRVWERGIGETLACGSGICAAMAAAASLQRTGPHIRVEVPGGSLEVEWEPGGHIWLTGPAEEVFEGEIDSHWLEARGLERHAGLVGEAI
ncbi:MAG: diaminopimelate epimerase [Actinomycetota bacterium]